MPADLDWIADQLRDFSEFFGAKIKLFGDPEFVRQQLLEVIIKHKVFVAETDECGHLPGDCAKACKIPMGFIAGLVSPNFFNPSIRVLTELFWWVKPVHRNSRAGLMLLEDFVAWGRSNCDWITFSLEAKSPVNDQALFKRGFSLHERIYLMEVR